MSITEEQAVRIAREYLAAMSKEARIELVFLENHTIVKGFGWVFFYDSKRHIESREFRDKLAGNAPFIVAKEDGSVHVTGTAHPVEFYLKNFERDGSPFGETGQSP